MSSWRQLQRLADGLSLIAKEIVKRSQAIESARNGDPETLLASSLKRAVVLATDISGLTSGKVRQYSKLRPKESSVVYFNNDISNSSNNDSSVVTDSRSSREEPGSNFESNFGTERNQESVVDSQVLSNNLGDKDLSLERECEVKNLGDKDNIDEGGEALAPAPIPIPVKRRKPRERKVPSTPFSRAIG